MHDHGVDVRNEHRSHVEVVDRDQALTVGDHLAIDLGAGRVRARHGLPDFGPAVALAVLDAVDSVVLARLRHLHGVEGLEHLAAELLESQDALLGGGADGTVEIRCAGQGGSLVGHWIPVR